jgi:hypothetical protein
MKKLAFDANGITLEPYSDTEWKRGKTPDFKLYKNGKLCGYPTAYPNVKGDRANVQGYRLSSLI